MKNALHSSRPFEDLALEVNRTLNHDDHNLNYQIYQYGIHVDDNRNNKKNSFCFLFLLCKAIIWRQWERVHFSFFSTIFTQVPIQDYSLLPFSQPLLAKPHTIQGSTKTGARPVLGNTSSWTSVLMEIKVFLEHVYPHSITCSVSRRAMGNKWPCFCARFCWFRIPGDIWAGSRGAPGTGTPGECIMHWWCLNSCNLVWSHNLI